MRIWALAALLLTGAAPSQDLPLPLDIGGRVIEQPNDTYRFGWPGVYFEGRFEGDWVGTAIKTDTESFRLLIDGKERARLGPDKQNATIEGLGPGVHTVRLEKLTESQSGSSLFYGFAVDRTARPLPPLPSRTRIEFIGDSHTVGYGNTSASRTCTQKEIHDTTDTQQAFGPLAAKRLNADYRVIAYSGYGVVRNYNGGVPGDSLPKRYARAIPGEEAAAKPDGWKPNWIVIKLGANDFSTPLHAGEAWADDAALHADYRARYVEFIRTLAAAQPQAKFLLIGDPNYAEDVRAVAETARAAGEIHTIITDPFENSGCDWHPSLKDHRALGDRVAMTLVVLATGGDKD